MPNGWWDQGDAPVGAGGCHRRISFMIAVTYGRRSRSTKSGRRCVPTTRSISSCARACTSGCSAIASRNTSPLITVWLTKPGVSWYDRRKSSWRNARSQRLLRHVCERPVETTLSGELTPVGHGSRIANHALLWRSVFGCELLQ